MSCCYGLQMRRALLLCLVPKGQGDGWPRRQHELQFLQEFFFNKIQQLSFECCWHSYLACCCGGHVCWRYTAVQLAVTLLVLRQCELKLVSVPAASLGTLQVQQVWCEA
jgi:hypothetical protein